MKPINAPNAPAALGPYRHGNIVGNLLFTSGQIALDPETGEIKGGSIETQTEQVMKNLTAILKAAGTDWSRVAKATLYLVDLADYAACNKVYERMLGDAKPARSVAQITGLPKGARLEIDVVAEI